MFMDWPANDGAPGNARPGALRSRWRSSLKPRFMNAGAAQPACCEIGLRLNFCRSLMGRHFCNLARADQTSIGQAHRSPTGRTARGEKPVSDIPTPLTDSIPPSRRWRNFEAEAWPLTAWRFDTASPVTATQIGRNISGRLAASGSTTNFRLFPDEETVFASASPAGVQHYIARNTSIFSHYSRTDFKNYFNKYQTLTENESIYAINAEKPAIGYLYKIKTDTHNSLSYLDLNEQFGIHAEYYIYRGGRQKFPRTKAEMAEAEAENKKILGTFNGNPGNQARLRKRIHEVHMPMDEIHIRGPLKKRRVGDSPASGSYTFASCDWLDLAIL